MSLLEQKVPWGTRTCGSCTACCKTHSVEDLALAKPAGVWCTHCGVGKGCNIYGNRPEMCRLFVCEWIKGVGGENHRPDHTKVVVDYLNLPNGLPGGVAQIWELSEGALSKSYTKNITREALAAGVWVSHISLAGHKKKLFVPPSRRLTQTIIEAAGEAGMEICSSNQIK